MSKARAAKAQRIRELLETEGDAVAENTRHFNTARKEAAARSENFEQLREEARAIKEDAIERLPELIDQLTESVEANGGTVYVAEDAADANRYIREVVEGKNADRVVKSKSMTTEEIEVNEDLERIGVDVVETDLGEWVIQLADETPSHIIGPAVHKSREEIADLFNEVFDPDERLETAEELTNFARDRLGELIKDADVGMTGANFITADSGSIAIVTNEGNARKTVEVPDTHIAVSGVEKILPTVEDLQPFTELIAKTGTGQDIAAYVSLFTPPVDSPPVDFDDPDTPIGKGGADRDFHLVLIDNGRLAMREDDQLRETLYCIRCGACANSCGNFQSVGGHAFGGETYTGGIATGWEAGIEGLDVAAEFNDLCTGCTRCVPACPVKIDIPWINTVVRDRINRRGEDGSVDWLVEGLTPDEEPSGLDLGKRFFGNFETVAKLGSATAPVSNWVAGTEPVRKLMDRTMGIDRRRDLPEFESESLVEWFRRRGGSRVAPEDAEREAVLYPDVYTNYIHTERGKAAVRTLEAFDVAVSVPDIGGSGRAPLSQGMVSTAADRAHEVYGQLAEPIDAGRDVVVVEPSDLAMFHREYGKFLADRSHERLEENSYELLEYVFGLLHNGGDPGTLRGPESTGIDAVAYHAHCQQRTLGVEGHTVAVLEERGYDVTLSDTECCGMAGSFGYKSEYYELSMDVGEPIVDQFGDLDRPVVASGTSCLDHIEELLSEPTRHPIELLAPA